MLRRSWEVRANDRVRGFSDEGAVRHFLFRFVDDHAAMAQLRRSLAELQGGSLERWRDRDVIEALARQIATGRLVVVTGDAPTAPGGDVSTPVRPTPAITALPQPAESPKQGRTENEEYELVFELEDEGTGLLLPFHRYRILDAQGSEVASGETDRDGAAVVDVPKEEEYEVVPYEEATHSLRGQVLNRGSREPVAGVEVEAADMDGETLSGTSDADGFFDFGEQREGYWVLTVEDVEMPLHLDTGSGECTLYVDSDSEEGAEAEASQDWHDAVDAIAPSPNGPVDRIDLEAF